MIDTLIVVKSNQYGLTRDAELLASALSDAGVKTEVAGISGRPLLDRLLGRKRARRIIHLERVFPQWISAADVNMLVPNQERFPRRHLGRLRKIDLILAKTREASGAFADCGVPVEHLGFTSQDRFDPKVVERLEPCPASCRRQHAERHGGRACLVGAASQSGRSWFSCRNAATRPEAFPATYG